jgi:hypothetical protein
MKLLEEIRAKCTPEQIAARNDVAIAALVNAGRTKPVMVPIADVQAYLQGNGAWWAIKKSPLPAAVATMDVANARYEHIDTSLPFVQGMLGGLVDAGLITPADHDAINAMGVAPDPVDVNTISNTLNASA